MQTQLSGVDFAPQGPKSKHHTPASFKGSGTGLRVFTWHRSGQRAWAHVGRVPQRRGPWLVGASGRHQQRQRRAGRLPRHQAVLHQLRRRQRL